MQGIYKSILSIIVLSFFMLSQGLILMPHHHHESNALPCFIITHCADDCHYAPIEGAHHDNDGCCNHHHDNTAVCDYKIDVMIDVRPPHLPLPTLPTDLLSALLPDFADSLLIQMRHTTTSVASSKIDNGDTSGYLCVAYIAVAHTPRTDLPYCA